MIFEQVPTIVYNLLFYYIFSIYYLVVEVMLMHCHKLLIINSHNKRK